MRVVNKEGGRSVARFCLYDRVTTDIVLGIGNTAEHYHRLDMYRAEVIIPMGLAAMLIQASFFSWAYPRLFSIKRADWKAGAVWSAATFACLAWSFTTLPVAAKYRMTSVADFLALETCFTLVQFAVVAPLIALAHRSKD